MPSPNVLKIDVEDSFYHIFARGASKQAIFVDELDYLYFENLFARYLSNKPMQDKQGMAYPNYNGSIELLAFCLMPNHFHLLIYQRHSKAMTRLLRGVCGAYSSYFNKKYKRIGPLFQDRFKANLISRDEYLQHISRYIHLNPKDYRTWEFSSLAYYLGVKKTAWIRPERILGLFNTGEYAGFVADYQEHREMLDEIKTELANNDVT